MKKQLIFLCALAVVASACNVKESELSTGLRLVTFTASSDSPADTKTSYTDSGKFSWTAYDKIAVYTDAGRFYSMELTDGAGTGTGTFTGEIEGTPLGYAVYPYLSTYPTYDGTTLSVYLPTSYEWSDEANNPMVGKISDNEAIYFENLAGLIRLKLNQVPAGATKMTFSANKRISGWFEVNNLNSDIPPTINTEDNTEDNTYKSVTFTFDTLEGSTDMVFYIPIPEGENYIFSFDVQDETRSLWESTASDYNSIKRNTLLLLDLGTTNSDSEREDREYF